MTAPEWVAPDGWCGAAQTNKAGGSPHHCNLRGDLHGAAHACPCGANWHEASPVDRLLSQAG